jgi:DNA-binding transcriptional regulator YiaG
MHNKAVYFVQSRASGLIKIGRTKDWQRRQGELEFGNGDRLDVLAVIRPADFQTEQALHARFNHLRCHGEWFSPGQELLDFIRQTAKTLVFKRAPEAMLHPAEVEDEEPNIVPEPESQDMTPETIKALRRRLGMTQEEFAHEVGLETRGAVARLESTDPGVNRAPTGPLLRLLERLWEESEERG